MNIGGGVWKVNYGVVGDNGREAKSTKRPIIACAGGFIATKSVNSANSTKVLSSNAIHDMSIAIFH